MLELRQMFTRLDGACSGICQLSRKPSPHTCFALDPELGTRGPQWVKHKPWPPWGGQFSKANGVEVLTLGGS